MRIVSGRVGNLDRFEDLTLAYENDPDMFQIPNILPSGPSPNDLFLLR